MSEAESVRAMDAGRMDQILESASMFAGHILQLEEATPHLSREDRLLALVVAITAIEGATADVEGETYSERIRERTRIRRLVDDMIDLGREMSSIEDERPALRLVRP